jgi:hypothetical protein
MGLINHGTQDITYNYFESATSLNFNKRMKKKLNPGIYEGGYLTRVSDTEVTLSTMFLEIGDGTSQISVETSTTISVTNLTLDSGTLSSATPYLVLRWAYSASATNYFEIHMVASVALAQANDVIVGKVNFSGSVITGFDYADRTPIGTYDSFLRIEATPETELYVRVRGGRVQLGNTVQTVKSQKVGPFSVPAAPNSRWDLVYLDTNGNPQISQGTQAINPTIPAHAGKLVLAQVLVGNGVSNITADNIRDFRTCISAPAIPDDTTIELNSEGKLAIKTSTAFGAPASVDSLGGTLAVTNIYKAPVDGFILVVQAGGGDCQVRIGAINPPTLLAGRHTWSSSTTYGQINVPVPKDYYVQVTGNVGWTPPILWIPMGTGNLVKQ